MTMPRTLWVVAAALLATGLPAGCQPADRQPDAAAPHAAAPAEGKTCPMVLDLGGSVKARIVGVRFADEVKSVDQKLIMPSGQREPLRFCIVTLRIEKPAGKRLALAAADLTAHYWHADEALVTPCIGLSHFSATPDADRPMQLVPFSGFAFIRSVTGASTTQSTALFVDAVFGYVPGDTRELWVCTARPVQDQPAPCTARPQGE